MRISDWSSDVCSSDLLNSEQNGRQRCTENGGHASRGARAEQRLALCRTQAETLGEQRPDGSAGHNERPFRTARTAAADGNGRGQGLRQRDLQGQAAFPVQARLKSFWYAVSPHLLGTITRKTPTQH